MNIIKFKDILMPGEDSLAKLFNEYFKGKYAYWVQMRYAVSFDHMDKQEYINCETDICNLVPNTCSCGCDCGDQSGCKIPYIDVLNCNELLKYIDIEETDSINDDKDLRIYNEYVTDSDITIEDVREFRTWLAESLLNLDKNKDGQYQYKYFTSTDIHVLEYYKNHMYDETLEILNKFNELSTPKSNNYCCGCGCQHNTCSCGELDLSALMTDTQACNTEEIYRKQIYLYMVSLFSKMEFWKKWTPSFIGLVKKYVDNIIKLDLPLAKSKYDVYFKDCTSGAVISDQERFMDMLKKFSNALGFIQNGQENGHKNFINDALSNWATNLYEIMEWPMKI